jgi:rhodanese-related sulfurtransferase
VFPANVNALAHTLSYALIFGLVGFAFGAVLEMTGFGNTRKLAAQFYFRDLTVLKTMFTGIVVAAVLVALATSFGLLDMSRVWVNPTFLWPGIAGGLVMGVGFVVGGFCPGTSLVAAATGKLDGILFVAGALVGVGLFGETVDRFEPFFLSGNMGRYTLADWLALPNGVVVALVVTMALVMFAGAELLERRMADRALIDAALPLPRFRRVGAALLALGAGLALLHGQPDADARFARSPELKKRVAERAVFVSPAEVVALRKDLNLRVDVLDLREEPAFNLFHVAHAERVSEDELEHHTRLRAMQEAGPSVVTFLVANDEAQALSAYRRLSTQGVLNVYVVDGGMERWLELYPAPACVASRGAPDARWQFRYATGAALPSASPELPFSRSFRIPCDHEQGEPAPETHGFAWPEHPFERRVKLQTKALVKGGCG